MEFNPDIVTEDVQIDYEQITYLLQHDEEFFIQFFLRDELTHPVPEFHKDVFHLMVSTTAQRSVFALPRDHAKTTLAKLAVIWHFLFSKYRFIVYLSNTASVAVAAVNDIIAFMDDENFANVFGAPEYSVKQDGVGYYKFILKTPFGTKKCILKALGSGQQVRGLNIDNKRPQLAIVDDLEDNDNIATEELFKKLKRWFYGPFRKALDKFDHKIIQLGNMISNRCMLNEHCKSEFWFSRRFGALLTDGSTLWPDVWTYEKLVLDFKEYVERGLLDVWFAEMMNMPISGGRGLIKSDEIYYLPEIHPGDIEYGFITIDLAISDKSWAHKTVITAHGWNGHCWQQCDYFGTTGIDPIDLFDQVVAIAFKWGISYVGIEAVAYQAALKPVFEFLCLSKHIEGLEFVQLHVAGTRKVQRLATWAAMIKAKEYALTEGELVYTEQLLFFDPTKRENDDDYIDSAAHAVTMIDNFLYEVMESIGPKQDTEMKSSYQICEF